MKCTSPVFLQILEDQRNFVDREIFTQHLLEAHLRDTRTLSTFISPSVAKALEYNWEEKYLGEFCSELAGWLDDGLVVKGRRRWFGLKSNGLYKALVLVNKGQRASMEELIDWAMSIEFKDI